MKRYALYIIFLLSISSLSAPASQDIRLTTHRFDPIIGEPQLSFTLLAGMPESGRQGYYIVQLSGPVTASDRYAVENKGVILLDYIPDNAFIARMTHEQSEELLDENSVRWIGRYHPAYKIDPTIGTHEFRDPARDNDPLLTLVVRVHDLEDPETVAEQIEQIGGEIMDIATGINPRVVTHIAPDVVDDVARLEHVYYIMEKGEYGVLNRNTRWVTQTNVSGNCSIWNHGIHGENQLVAEMDSGVDYNSCFFRDPEGDPIGSNHRKVQSYGYYGGAAVDSCDMGHGTHVAGTLLGNDITGMHSAFNGMAYMARLVFQDIGVDDSWACTVGEVSPPTSLTGAYSDAYSAGARIHTNSWGGSSNEYNDYAEDIDDFMWNYPDFLVLFAMGNAGPDPSTIGYPATAKSCVSVGGTQQATTQYNMYDASSRGPVYDDRLKPTVCAPADGMNGGPPDIASANNDIGNPPSATCALDSSGWNGTSMATPAVAGCAVLVRQYYMDGYYPSGTATLAHAFTPSAALIKATLVAAGEAMTGSGISAYPDNNQGWGRVLLEKALFFLGDAVGLSVEDITTGITTGTTHTYNYNLDNGSAARFVLVWTDYPGAPPANPALVNNLNLRVSEPGGTQYWGNNFSGGQSVTGGSADNLNVVEVVQRNVPSTGSWTVEVIGQNVPNGPQPYALVVTGSGLFIPVELQSFGARYDSENQAVILEWTTASEQDNLGFHIFRSREESGSYSRINEDIIPGSGTKSVPSNYRFTDSTSEPGTYFYKLLQVDTNGSQNFHGPISLSIGSGLPYEFSMEEPVPNPFDESVTVRYSLPHETMVKLSVYDISGHSVRTLVHENQHAGVHARIWDGTTTSGTASPGHYIIRLITDEYTASQPVILRR